MVEHIALKSICTILASCPLSNALCIVWDTHKSASQVPRPLRQANWIFGSTPLRGRMHKSSCGHLSKRRSNSLRRVLENKFIFTNLLSNGICMMPEVKKVVRLILIVIIKMSMASTSGNFFFTKLLEQLCRLHKMELN